MGGEIGVDSKPELGSTFWFTLPLLKQPAPDRKTLRTQANLAGLRALIVDGNETSRSVIEHCVSSLGIKSQSAEDGPTAMELLRISRATGEPFDLVIMEFMLPGMDGQELAQTIRNNSEFSALKLLLVTSVQKNGAEKLAKAAGVDAWLAAPVTHSVLAERLADLMAEPSRSGFPPPRCLEKYHRSKIRRIGCGSWWPTIITSTKSDLESARQDGPSGRCGRQRQRGVGGLQARSLRYGVNGYTDAGGRWLGDVPPNPRTGSEQGPSYSDHRDHSSCAESGSRRMLGGWHG